MTIPLVFFSLFILVLWFIIGSKGHWALKAGVIAMTLHFCISIGLSLEGFAGWPSEDGLPDKFIVHWIVVDEPDKKTKSDGAIYVWATDVAVETAAPPRSVWDKFFLNLSPKNTGQPRAYVVPYSKSKHEESDGVLTQIKGGKVVIGERGENGGEPGDGEEGSGDGDGQPDGSEGGGSFSRSDGITFHELPPTKLPKKIRN